MTRRKAAAGVMAASLLASLPAYAADPFTVVTVPWVATDPLVPHDGVDGSWHYLQAVGRGGDCVTIDYQWDFEGDGIYDAVALSSNDPRNLGYKHTYPSYGVDRYMVARIEATCGLETSTAEFPILLRVDPTLTQRVNRAISNGLWRVHTLFNRDEAQKRAWIRDEPSTAMNIQALMNRGHRAGVNPNLDPYYEDVLWSLHYLAADISRVDDLGAISDAQPDADINGSGYVLRPDCEENYCTGPVLEAFSSWGDMSYVIDPSVVDGGDVTAGMTIGDIVQEIAEYHYWSMSDISWNGAYAGGWDYWANSAAIDTSQMGWTAVGLFAAEVNGGVQTPQWVKDRTAQGALHSEASREGNAAVVGGFGYRAYDECGVSVARSGSMMSALGYAFDRDSQARIVVDAAKLIARNFNGPVDAGDCWGGTNLGNYYAMYQTAKGMRSFDPPIRYIGDANLDWFAALGDYLVANQDAEGGWTNDNRWVSNNDEANTAMGLLVAIPTVFEAEPVANARALPYDAGPADVVTFSHNFSYSLDPHARLVAYRWNFVDYPLGLDLNDDGNFDAEGEKSPEDLDGNGTVDDDEIVWEFVTANPEARAQWSWSPDIAFGEEVYYRVVLQVENAVGRTDIDDESVTVRISLDNHAPVALPHPSGNPDGVYFVIPGESYTLDGTPSYEPDSDDVPVDGFPVDVITSYGWDLDGDGIFEIDTPTAEFTADPAWPVGQARILRFRVCDDGRWNGRLDAECNGGDCTLCAEENVLFRSVASAAPTAAIANRGPGDGDPVDGLELGLGNALVIDAGPSSDPEGGILNYALDCGQTLTVTPTPDAAQIEVSAVGFEYNAESTDYLCTLTVTDPTDVSDDYHFVIRIILAPVVEAVAVAAAAVGVDVPVAVTASHPVDGMVMRYDIDCHSDGIYEFTDDEDGAVVCTYVEDDIGVDNVTVRVVDTEGIATVALSDAFQVYDTPPIFTDLSCPGAAEGEPMLLLLQVLDPAMPIPNCAGVGVLPDQATVDGDLCALLWTPTYEQALTGSVSFPLVVSDNDGWSAEGEIICAVTVRDDDGDGLPDTWEERNDVPDDEGNPDDGGADDDPDLDGATNGQELALGTHPSVFSGPGVPVMVTPAHESVVDTLRPSLEVEATIHEFPGDIDYTFAIYAPGDLDNAVWTAVVTGVGPVVSAEVDADLDEDARYMWRVRASDDYVAGAWTQMATFDVDATPETPTPPAIASPIEGELDLLAPTIALTNSSDPDPGTQLTYRCEVDVSEAFEAPIQSPLVDHDEDGQTELLLAPLQENWAYAVRCRAEDNTARVSDWTPTAHFRINVVEERPTNPAIVAPADGERLLVTTPTLQITPAVDPEGQPLTYHVRITDSAGGVVFDDAAVPGGADPIEVELPELSDDTIYQWFVTAADAHGVSQTVSASFTINVADDDPTAPAITEPAGGAELASALPAVVLVNGTDSDPGDAVGHRCQVARTDAFGGDDIVADVVDGPIPALDDNTRYWLRCRAEDATGRTSAWVGPVDFRINLFEERPSAPLIVSPDDQSRVQNLDVELRARGAVDPEGEPLTYGFEIATDPAFGEILARVEGVEPDADEASWAPAGLVDDTRYYWRAWADDGRGPSDSTTGGFVLNVADDTPSAPTIDSPVDGAELASTTPSLELTGGTDSDPGDVVSHRCQVARTDAFAGGLGEGDIVDDTVDGPLPMLDDNTRYWLRCRAEDTTGLASPWTATVGIRINQIEERPSAPQIVAPDDQSRVQVQNVELRARGAVDPEGESLTYGFEIATDPTFGEVLVRVEGVEPDADEASWTADGLADDTRYYWRAWADDGRGQSDPVAGGFVLNVADDAPTSPAITEPAVGDELTVVVPAVLLVDGTDSDPGDVVSHRCQVALADGFGDGEIIADVVDEPVPALQDNTRYWLRCRAEDTTGLASAWTETVGFRVNVVEERPTTPQIVAPDDQARVQIRDVELRARGAVDPEGEPLTYGFDIATDPAFGNIVALVAGVEPDGGEASWTAVELADDTRYYWRVWADDGRGQSDPATGGFVLNVADDAPTPPTIDAPLDGAELISALPILALTEGADTDPGDSLVHRCQVARTDEFGPGEVAADVLDGVLPALEDNTRYWLRCRAEDTTGLASPWSDTVGFRINLFEERPSAPRLVAPANQARIRAQDVELRVRGSVDPEGEPLTYGFEIATDPAFGDIVAHVEDIDPDNNEAGWIAETLPDDTRYYWRAWADDGRNRSDPLTGWFDVNVTFDPPTAPTILTPTDGVVLTNPVPVLTVAHATDPDPGEWRRYECQVAEDDGFEGVTQAPEFDEAADVETSSIQLAELRENTRYWMRCRARDRDATAGDWSDVVALRVNIIEEPPTVPTPVWPLDGARIEDETLAMRATAADDPEDQPLTYVFEVGFEPGFAAEDAIYTSEPVEAADGLVRHEISLDDDTVYYWRITVSDGHFERSAPGGRFVWNIADDAPADIEITSPVDAAELDATDFVAELTASADPDPDDALTYACELAADPDFDVDVHRETAADPAVSFKGFDDNTNYWLRCRAEDSTDLASAWTQTVAFRSNLVEQPPTAPTLIAPVDGFRMQDQPIELSWTAGIDPEGQPIVHYVEVATSDRFDEIVYTSLPIGELGPDIRFVLPIALGDDNVYAWRVWAEDERGAGEPVVSAFLLNTADDAPDAPIIISPSDGAEIDDTSAEVTLTGGADSDPGAEVNYHCQVAGDPQFAHVVRDAVTPRGNDGAGAWRLPGLVEDGRYWFRCRSLDQTGLASDWVGPHAIRVNTVEQPPTAPIALSPTDSERLRYKDITLVARAARDPEGEPFVHHFELASDATFAHVIYEGEVSITAGENPETVEFELPNSLTDDRVYSWRVWADDGRGQSPVATARFIVDIQPEAPTAPTIVEPARGSAVVTATPSIIVTHAEDDDPGAVLRYACQVSRDADGSDVIANGMSPESDADTTAIALVVPLPEDGQFWLRCRGIDETGLEGPWTPARPFRINTDEQPPSPVVLRAPGPDARVRKLRPDFVVANAVDPEAQPLVYHFELSRDAGFKLVAHASGPVAEGAGGETTYTVPIDLDDNAVWYWRVRPRDDAGLYGPWTAGNFAIDRADEPPTAPTIRAPVDGEIVHVATPEIAVDGATDPDVGAALDYECAYETLGAPVEPPLAENTEHAVRCRAVDEHGLTSEWSEPVRVFVTVVDEAPIAPEALSPRDDERVFDPRLTFVFDGAVDPDRDPLHYFVEIATDATFTTVLLTSGPIGVNLDRPTTYEPPVELGDNASYAWRVWASDGTHESPKAVATFQLDVDDEAPTAPTIIWPNDGDASDTNPPTLRVTGGIDLDPGAMLGYECEIIDPVVLDESPVVLAHGTGIASDEAEITIEPLADLGPLVENAHYAARCRAVDQTGMASPWTKPVPFRIDTEAEPPLAPIALEPVMGAIVDSARPTFVAGMAIDPEGAVLTYHFEIALDPHFADVIAWGDVATDDTLQAEFRWSPDDDLAENTMHYWRVRAWDGEQYGDADSGRFIVDAIEEAPPAPVVLAPTDGEHSMVTAPTFELTAVTDPDPGDTVHYACQIAADAEFEVIVAEMHSRDPGDLEVDAPLGDNASYVARCRAVDDAGPAGPWSAPVAFRVDTAPDAPVGIAIIAPMDGETIVELPLRLAVTNAIDPDGDPLTYTFEIARDAEFEDVVFELAVEEDSSGVTDVTADVSNGIVDNTVYAWRVTVRDPDGLSATVAAAFGVNTANDPPSAPEVRTFGGQPSTVDSLPIALRISDASDPDPGDTLVYRCQLGVDASFDAPIDLGEAVPIGPTHTAVITFDEALDENRRYGIRCRAVDTHDAIGPWSDPWIFRYDSVAEAPGAPDLIHPDEGATIDEQQPTVEVIGGFDPDGDAITYTVEISEDASFEEVVATAVDVPTDDPSNVTFIDLPELLADNQKHHWRVWASDGDHDGPMTESWFIVNVVDDPPTAPEIVVPSPGQEMGETAPVLVLTNGKDPDWQAELTYECEVSEADDFEILTDTAVTEEDPSGTSRVAMALELDAGVAYWARCRAIDETGLFSEWSTAVEFTIAGDNASPFPPLIESPFDGDRVSDPKVELAARGADDPDDDAVTYHFEAGADADFAGDVHTSGPIEPGDDGVARWNLPFDPAENQRIYWRVYATDGEATTDYATAWFLYDLRNEAPGVPTLLTPKDGAIVDGDFPEFEWTAVTDPEGDAVEYRIGLYSGTQPNNDSLIWWRATDDTSITYDGQLDPGTYSWGIQTQDPLDIKSRPSDYFVLIVEGEPGGLDPDAGDKPSKDPDNGILCTAAPGRTVDGWPAFLAVLPLLLLARGRRRRG